MDCRDIRIATRARALAAGLLALVACAADSRPVAVNAAAAVVVAPGYGGRWVGAPYRPGFGPGWRYGYPGWGYGYAGWGYRYPGYGYGYGYGWGWGYGAGWALATSPYWGWPAAPAAYVMPSWVPTEIGVPPSIFIEQAAPQPAAPAPPPAAPQAAPQQPGFWYYCTEPAGYYPYVSTCTRPWVAVQPTGR